MKVLLGILIGIGISLSANAQIKFEELSSLCRNGVPDGLADAWLTTESTRILDSITARSSTPVALNECTRITSELSNEIVNQGDKCTFAYNWEGHDMTLQLPEVLKVKVQSYDNGEVFAFEKGYQPNFMVSFSITAICKRTDGSGGYLGLFGEESLIELNP